MGSWREEKRLAETPPCGELLIGSVFVWEREFAISKSTVHKDVAERLSHINPPLASRARVVLDINKAERHIRGGMATKEKYEHEHQLRACSRDEE